MQTISRLLEMIRFSHTLFALPFAMLAAVMAWTTPVAATGSPPEFRWRELLGILLCMTTARSAAMAFNRLVDRRIDAANPRTEKRHLPAGELTVGGVVAFTLVSSVLFIASTMLFLPNPLPIVLSVPVLLVLLAYTYTKRFTALAHFWLGMSLMLAPVSTWIALRGQVLLSTPADMLPAVMLGAAVLLWVAGFDIIYACQDAEFDRSAKLHSVPSTIGVPLSLRLAAACHLAMLVVLAALPWAFPQVELGWTYGLGVTAAGTLLVIEHLLVRPDDLTRVNIAFFNINAIVSMGLFLAGSVDMLLM